MIITRENIRSFALIYSFRLAWACLGLCDWSVVTSLRALALCDWSVVTSLCVGLVCAFGRSTWCLVQCKWIIKNYIRVPRNGNWFQARIKECCCQFFRTDLENIKEYPSHKHSEKHKNIHSRKYEENMLNFCIEFSLYSRLEESRCVCSLAVLRPWDLSNAKIYRSKNMFLGM